MINCWFDLWSKNIIIVKNKANYCPQINYQKINHTSNLLIHRKLQKR